jgi:hypothetical protein
MSDTVSRFEYSSGLALLDTLMSPLKGRPGIGCVTALDIARTACRAEGHPLVHNDDDVARVFGAEFLTAVDLSTRWPMSAMGQVQWRAVLATAARLRLQLDDYLAQGRPLGTVERPLVIVGLPRTGTTLLQSLLACDPERAGLPFWQLMRPIPHPDRPLDNAVRRMNGAFASWLYRAVAPEYPTLHLTTSTTLEECWYLMMPSFMVLNADFPMPSPAYGDWILGQDMRPAYDRYRTLLRILQLQVGTRRLVLKCPDHLWFLDSLLGVLPDAEVIWTHRDPAKSLPSYAAQMALPGRQYMGRIDPHVLGERLKLRFRQGIDRANAARRTYPNAKLVDVCYSDLAARPVETALTTLRRLGHEPSATHERSMRNFMHAQASQPRAHHSYRPETYGLSATGLHELFADYIQTFGVERES